jgi:hypothetical protein
MTRVAYAFLSVSFLGLACMIAGLGLMQFGMVSGRVADMMAQFGSMVGGLGIAGAGLSGLVAYIRG